MRKKVLALFLFPISIKITHRIIKNAFNILNFNENLCNLEYQAGTACYSFTLDEKGPSLKCASCFPLSRSLTLFFLTFLSFFVSHSFSLSLSFSFQSLFPSFFLSYSSLFLSFLSIPRSLLFLFLSPSLFLSTHLLFFLYFISILVSIYISLTFPFSFFI
jgi:hypothetical protein